MLMGQPQKGNEDCHNGTGQNERLGAAHAPGDGGKISEKGKDNAKLFAAMAVPVHNTMDPNISRVTCLACLSSRAF
jgi:hypothetical protein